MPCVENACAGKSRRIPKGQEKLQVNPPPGGEGKALLGLSHRTNRPQTLNLISRLLKIATCFVPMGTTLDRVPEVIILLLGHSLLVALRFFGGTNARLVWIHY